MLNLKRATLTTTTIDLNNWLAAIALVFLIVRLLWLLIVDDYDSDEPQQL